MGKFNCSLTPPLFIEVPVPSQESEQSRLCVGGINFVFLRFYDSILERFRHVLYIVFHFITIYINATRSTKLKVT